MSLATTSGPLNSVPRLHGRQLIAAQAMMLVAIGLTAVIYIAAVTSVYTIAQVTCIDTGDNTCIWAQLLPQSQARLREVGISIQLYALLQTACTVLISLPWIAVGLLIVWSRPQERMAYIAAGFLLLNGITNNTDALVWAHPQWQWPIQLLNALSLFLVIPIACLFPDGRWIPRWALWLLPLCALWSLVISFAIVPSWTDGLIGFGLFGGILLLAGGLQTYRYRRVSGPIERQQAKWVMFGLLNQALLAAIWIGVAGIWPASAGQGRLEAILMGNLFNLSTLFFPLAIGVAVLRYRLWDIDILINRTLVYGALTACVVGIYVIVVGYLGALFRTSQNLAISLIATGLVAMLFQPLRAWLQRGANRLLYGDRDEPYAVVARLGQRLEAALAPETVLPAIVETVAQALRLPYAAIVLKHEDVLRLAAAHGQEQEELLSLPLMYHNETVGQLLLAPRAPGERFSPADQRLLSVLAQQAGVAAHAVRLTLNLQQLTTDLQRSREQLITAREEERRRLRRDLHDGIGPTLASLSQRLDAALYLVRDDPDASIAILGEVKGHVRRTLADIRRLVYALRPPVLDELGLAAAIREHAASYQYGSGVPGGSALSIAVDVPDTLPQLPAAVELTAYRIALEALTNIVRHAQASSCTIRLALAGAGARQALAIEVADDGIGLAPGHPAGVGLASIRERVAEIGGTCTIDAPAEGGTRVCAWLPITL